MIQSDENSLKSDQVIEDDSTTVGVGSDHVSECFRILQPSEILTDTAIDFQAVDKIKEENSLEANEVTVKSKRGRPTKQVAATKELADKRAKLVELALQEANASLPEYNCNLKSVRLREKVAKNGGLKRTRESSSREDSFEEITTDEETPIPIKSERQVETNMCELCAGNGEFASMEELKNHRKETHPASFHCDICGKGFNDQNEFFEHLKFHYENTEQPKRPRGRPRKNPLHPSSYEPMQESNDEIDGEASSNVQFTDTDEGEGKNEEDVGTSDHCCKLCQAVFPNRSQLTQHMKDDHQIVIQRGRKPKYPHLEQTEDGAYICPHCNRSFTHKNSLMYHIKTHTGDRPHMCDICGKTFFVSTALKVHMRVHTGDRPYKCNDCGKKFRQEGDLKYHQISLHSDIRLYQCEYCDKSFARKYSLTVHRRVHTGERSYICEFCHKGFRASSYLLAHRKVHTGEKPYSCQICQKSFRMRSDMKRHLQMHSRKGHNVSSDGFIQNPQLEVAVLEHEESPEAKAIATIQDEESEMIMALMPNENGDLYAVPVQMLNSDYTSNSMPPIETVNITDLNEEQILQLFNGSKQIQEREQFPNKEEFHYTNL